MTRYAFPVSDDTKVTRLEVRADNRQAIEAAKEAKKAWLEVDAITRNLGGNVFGGGTVPGAPAARGTNAPGSATFPPGGAFGGASPGAATQTSAGPRGLQALVRGDGGGWTPARPVPGASTHSPAPAPRSSEAPSVPNTTPSGDPPASPPRRPRRPREQDDDDDRDSGRTATRWATTTAVRAFQAISSGGAAAPEVAALGLGASVAGASAQFAAASGYGKTAAVLGSIGGVLNPLASLMNEGGQIALQRTADWGNIQSRFASIREGVGVSDYSATRLKADAFGNVVRHHTYRDPFETDQFELLRRGAQLGYSPDETTGIAEQYDRAVGHQVGLNKRMSESVLKAARLGIGPSAVGAYESLSRAGVSAPSGNAMSVAALAWSQGLRGGQVDKYLQSISASVEAMARSGVKVDLGEYQRFIGRAQATPGLADTGEHQTQAANAYMGMAQGAANRLLSPFRALAEARLMSRAFREGGGYAGAIDWLQGRQGGGNPNAVNDTMGSGELGDLTRASATGLPLDEARALGPGRFASRAARPAALPEPNAYLLSRARLMAEKQVRALERVPGLDMVKGIYDRMLSWENKKASAFEGFEGMVSGNGWTDLSAVLREKFGGATESAGKAAESAGRAADTLESFRESVERAKKTLDDLPGPGFFSF